MKLVTKTDRNLLEECLTTTSTKLGVKIYELLATLDYTKEYKGILKYYIGNEDQTKDYIKGWKGGYTIYGTDTETKDYSIYHVIKGYDKHVMIVYHNTKLFIKELKELVRDKSNAKYVDLINKVIVL